MAVGSHCKDPQNHCPAPPVSLPRPVAGADWRGAWAFGSHPKPPAGFSPSFLAPPTCHWPPQPTCSDSGFSLALIPSLSSLLPDSGLWALLAPVPPPHGGSRMGFRPAGLTPSQRCPWVPFLYSIQGKHCVSHDPLPDPPTPQPPHTPCPSPQPHTCIRGRSPACHTRSHRHTSAHAAVPSASSPRFPPPLANSFQSSSKSGGLWHFPLFCPGLEGSAGVLPSARSHPHSHPHSHLFLGLFPLQTAGAFRAGTPCPPPTASCSQSLSQGWHHVAAQ